MKTISVISTCVGLLLSVGILVDAWLKGFVSYDWLPIFIGGMFFLLLAFINEKNNFKSGGPYVSITIAMFFIFNSYMGIVTGHINWVRYSSYTYLETEPDKFWALITFGIVVGVVLTIYSYWSFKKLYKQCPTHHSSGTPNGVP